MTTSHDTPHLSHRYGNTLGIIIFGLALLLLVLWFVWLNLKIPLG